MSPSPSQSKKHNSLLDNWRGRLDDLLKVKSVDDLRLELVKLGGEIQKEITNFDVHQHLSPDAKKRVKKLERAYGDVQKSILKVQKQVDREFNKSLRVLKKTRKDAEKQVVGMTKKVKAQRTRLEKAAKNITKTTKKKRKTKRKTKKAKVVRKKTTKKKA